MGECPINEGIQVNLQNAGVMCAALLAIAATPAAVAQAHPVASTHTAFATGFTENAGQWDARVAFRKRTFAGELFVLRDGRWTYRLPAPSLSPSPSPSPKVAAAAAAVPAAPSGGWALTESLVGARDADAAQVRGASLIGRDPLPVLANFFVGDAALHRSNVASFQRIDLGERYPGVRVELVDRGDNVEKLFHVAPRADAAQIRVKIEGAKKLIAHVNGAIVAETGYGEFAFSAPIAFQYKANSHELDAANADPVAVRYHLFDDGESYGFTLGNYDRSRPVVIDPIIRATYLGGSGNDVIADLAIHPTNGDLYAVGTSYSADMPPTTGGAFPSNPNPTSGAAFIARFSPSLETLHRITYLGNTSNSTWGRAVAIDPIGGAIFLVGETNALLLPGTLGAAQPVKNSLTDAFVTKFSSDLASVIRTTYYGQTGSEFVNSAAFVAATDALYIGGVTTSTTLPQIAGAAQATPPLGSSQSPYLARISGDLTSIVQSTFLGGDLTLGTAQTVEQIARSPFNGDLYVVGATDSFSFPGTAGGAQPTRTADTDAYVARVNAALTAVVAATYLGGNSIDWGYGLAIEGSGAVLVTGSTRSNNFPVDVDAAQTNGGNFASTKAFITRLSSSLGTRLNSTYFGGSSFDFGYRIASNAAGDVYTTGAVRSRDLPGVATGAQSLHGGDFYDNYVARHSANLKTLHRSTYFGGNKLEEPRALAIHAASGDVIIAGFTESKNLRHTSTGAQPVAGDGSVTPYDGFIARVSGDLSGPACNFDADGNGQLEAAYDGVLTLRAMLGFGSTSLTAGAVSTTTPYPLGPPRATASALQSFWQTSCATLFSPGAATVLIGGGPCSLDLDGDGAVRANSDGLMLLRMMVGLTGGEVTAAAVNPTAPRNTWSAIRTYVNTSCNANF